MKLSVTLTCCWISGLRCQWPLFIDLVNVKEEDSVGLPHSCTASHRLTTTTDRCKSVVSYHPSVCLSHTLTSIHSLRLLNQTWDQGTRLCSFGPPVSRMRWITLLFPISDIWRCLSFFPPGGDFFMFHVIVPARWSPLCWTPTAERLIRTDSCPLPARKSICFVLHRPL